MAEGIQDPAGRVLGENSAAQALIHFYRGELARSDQWRTRLDTTTNWAVATTGALLSVAFSAGDVASGIFPLAAGLLLLFLAIEARRYTYYDVSIGRVRAMEQAFFAPLFAREPVDEPTLRALADELRRPQIRTSLRHAAAIRLWRTYAWLYAVLYVAWFARLWTQPGRPSSLTELVQRLGEGPIHGLAIFIGASLLLAWVVGLSLHGLVRGLVTWPCAVEFVHPALRYMIVSCSISPY